MKYHICVICEKSKPLTKDFFIKVHNSKTGFSHICIDCDNNHEFKKQRVGEIAKQYKHRVDFKKGKNYLWQWARRQGSEYYESIVSHMGTKGTWYKKLVYKYEFENNVVYIGITNDKEQRKFSHQNLSGAVYEYSKENNETPIYTELTGYIDVKEAAKMETELIKEYRDKGWVVLNKTNGGEIGGNNEFLTKEECHKEALKYNFRGEFHDHSRNHWQKAHKRGWMDDICGHMGKKLTDWNEELILETARNSGLELISDFSKIYKGAYDAAKRLKIMDRLRECFDWKGGYSWTKEEIHNIAKRYTVRSKFIRENKNASWYAQRKGWYDEITSHMEFQSKGKKWTKEEVHAEALKYKTRTQFANASDTKGCNRAYQSALHNGWIDEVCSHMTKLN
jgi:predicted GIY-YIG superfamily endonuclease